MVHEAPSKMAMKGPSATVDAELPLKIGFVPCPGATQKLGPVQARPSKLSEVNPLALAGAGPAVQTCPSNVSSSALALPVDWSTA